MHTDPQELSLDHPVHDLDPNVTTQEEASALRRYGHVVPVTLMGVRAWVAVTEESVRTLFEAQDDFAKNSAHWGAYQRGEIPAGWPLLSFIIADSMLNADGIDHMRLRRLVTFAFTPKRVSGLGPRIQEACEELLSRLADGPLESVDLKAQFAYHLPLAIIWELFGVTDPAQRTTLMNNYETMLSAEASNAEREAAAAAQHEELRRLVRARRAAPGNDLTSALAETLDGDGGQLSEKELIDTLDVILIAGHQTTVNSLTNTILALLAHPDQLALLKDGTVEWTTAVEAGLHWNAPLRNLPMRYALRDTVLHGVTVRRGEPVLAGVAAANRGQGTDGVAQFDLLRPQGKQLAFGAGPHFCIGSALARLESAIALRALFERFPDIRLAVPEAEVPSLVSTADNGVAALPVNLKPSPLPVP